MAFSNKTIASNMIWGYAGKFLTQAVSFIVAITLARLLLPSQFGIVALATVIITFFESFTSQGFNRALIQKKDVDELDYSTIFVANMTLQIGLYVMVFIFAPMFASFYEMEMLCPLIRVGGLKLLISGFNSIQQAYVQRNMQGRKFFFSTLGGTLLAAIVGVVLAFQGFGAWALIISSLCNALVDMLVLFFTIKWKPSLKFSIIRLKNMAGFGIRSVFVFLFASIYNSLRTLMIGKVYSSDDLAYYNKGEAWPLMIVSNIQMSVTNVMFAALSQEDQRMRIKQKTRKFFSMMFFIIAPLLAGLSFASESVISVLHTDKWMPNQPFIIIFSISYLTWVPLMAWNTAIEATGREDTMLKINTICQVSGLILLFLFIKKGTLLVAMIELFKDIINIALTYIYSRKYFDYKIKEVFLDIYKTILSVFFMGVAAWFVQKITDIMVLKLILQLTIGGMVYIASSHMMKNDNYYFSLNLVKMKVLGKSE